MPRVNINKRKYILQDFGVWMIGRMRTLKISQTDMGKLLGISQPAFSNRLKNSKFDYSQMLEILNILEATDEEILRFMKL